MFIINNENSRILWAKESLVFVSQINVFFIKVIKDPGMQDKV